MSHIECHHHLRINIIVGLLHCPMQFSGSHMIVVMIAIVVIMLVIMLAMVVIMMVMVTPFAIDLFIVVLLNMSICCMCDITTTAGSSRL